MSATSSGQFYQAPIKETQFFDILLPNRTLTAPVAAADKKCWMFGSHQGHVLPAESRFLYQLNTTSSPDTARGLFILSLCCSFCHSAAVILRCSGKVWSVQKMGFPKARMGLPPPLLSHHQHISYPLFIYLISREITWSGFVPTSSRIPREITSFFVKEKCVHDLIHHEGKSQCAGDTNSRKIHLFE